MTTPLDDILAGAPEPQGDASLDTAQTEPRTDTEPQTVPLAALKEERAKARRYTDQVADFEKKVEGLSRDNAVLRQHIAELLTAVQEGERKPDFFENPEQSVRALVHEIVSPLAAGHGRVSEAVSRLSAMGEHGADAVNAAYAELENRINADPAMMRAEYQRIMGSPNPWGELVKWHRKEAALRDVGEDPEAFEQRLREKILAELSGKRALPSNLAGARNAGTRSGPAWGGPQTIKDIFDRASKARA
jgi:hypothetical protein